MQAGVDDWGVVAMNFVLIQKGNCGILNRPLAGVEEIYFMVEGCAKLPCRAEGA